MQYISFYKDRLPFKPKTNVVIYFDVMDLGAKKYYHVLYDFYDVLVEEFSHSRDSDLLEYVVAGFDASRLEPGLIQYKGEDFDKEDTYTYAFTPMTDVYSRMPYEMAEKYVRMHGVSGDFFGRSHDRQLDRLRYEEEKLQQMRLEEACCEEPCPEPPSSPSLFGRLTSAFRSRKEADREECRAQLPEEEVEAVMSEVQILVERLRQSGVGEWALQALFQPTQKLSRLHVRYGRIFLPDYNNVEIKMPPLSKAIYLLYLRHPEGIKFSNLPEYRKELLSVYEMISGRDSREDIRRSIDDVTDPTRNSINEKCSRIKQAFLRVFDDSIARNYYITGERGEAKKILLPQDMIVWENFR